MNKHYVQGFIDKCAEAGIDPEELIKLSRGLGYGEDAPSMVPQPQPTTTQDPAVGVTREDDPIKSDVSSTAQRKRVKTPKSPKLMFNPGQVKASQGNGS